MSTSEAYSDYVNGRATLQISATPNKVNSGLKIGPVHLGMGHVLQLRGSFGSSSTVTSNNRWILTLFAKTDADGV
jgi:hypothetical protein